LIRFNNDYNRSAHPDIIQALENTNSESYGGYGIDTWCESACAEIKKYLGSNNCDIHFLVGATQANYTIIASALRPFESIICADSGHINVHETGAVENTGHKITALTAKDGKITASQIAAQAELFSQSKIKEHITEPKLVYISFPTEYGTIYKKQELKEISDVCKKYGMYLFADGARLGYGLGSDECDLTLSDLASLTDVFYIGGTKCGALFGEAVIITNNELKKNFRSYMKQNGALLAKGWLLGIQFYTLFKNGLYFDITKKADALALQIKKAFAEKGIQPYIDSSTNQQFMVLPNSLTEKLSKKYIFEFEAKIDEENSCVRFCTSWGTSESDVNTLIDDIHKL